LAETEPVEYRFPWRKIIIQADRLQGDRRIKEGFEKICFLPLKMLINLINVLPRLLFIQT
jgi:hypothetical protein